jgi:FlaA1/EpsC-like NDP-sugar epimerase
MVFDRIRDAILVHRKAAVIVIHAVLAFLSLFLAFLIRFDFGGIPPTYGDLFRMALPWAVGLKLLALFYFGSLSGLWRYVGVSDLVQIIKAVTISSLAFVVAVVLTLGHGFPRSIFLLDYVLTIVLFGGSRLCIRLFRESFRPAIRRTSGKRTLIIGAGDTGETAVRSLTNDHSGLYQIVGILDDDPHKKGLRMHGYRIIGTIAEAPELVRDLEVTEVLIAIPSAGKALVRKVVESCAGHDVNFRIMPAIRDLMTGALALDKIREVRVEDLLGRDPVQLDSARVVSHLGGECVLVTGAGGSIGSEICRQVAKFEPSRLVLFEVAESPLFDIENEIRESCPSLEVHGCVGDIKHADEVDAIFARFRPDRVYHAAAYKHVPLMEVHAVEAVRNNVMGTRHVVEACIRHRTGSFVLISTDKAVRPGNVMGATKRIGELIVARAHAPGSSFASVRFGNVLGSCGSVVPIFERQIRRGGPVRVTHPDMTRFFMTIPEAVELVLHASALAAGHDVFVLDMGEPVRIMDLARNMIELSGLAVGTDIKIEVTGVRPGEKLHEELVTYGEALEPTQVDKISVLRKGEYAPGGPLFDQNLDRLIAAALARDQEKTLRLLSEIIRADEESALVTPPSRERTRDNTR